MCFVLLTHTHTCRRTDIYVFGLEGGLQVYNPDAFGQDEQMVLHHCLPSDGEDITTWSAKTEVHGGSTLQSKTSLGQQVALVQFGCCMLSATTHTAVFFLVFMTGTS